MLPILQVLALLLVAVAFGLALAHALELPGKLRLHEQQYRMVQRIYHPGFAIGGAVGEAGGLLATLLLVLLSPAGSLVFWLSLGAFLALAAMHLVFWIVTRPVNGFWLADLPLPGDWRHLRDRWELSHLVRAALALAGLALLAAAVAL